MCTQTELAIITSIDPAIISKILSGKRIATRHQAASLEAATGIPRLAWLYPTDYHNPMIRSTQHELQTA